MGSKNDKSRDSIKSTETALHHINSITDIQSNILEWVKLIETTTYSFRKQFEQLVVFVESSDPVSSMITNESLMEFNHMKGDIVKHVSGLTLIKELSTDESVKLSFKLMHLIDSFQNPLRQMRKSLEDPHVKSSITSSDFSHLAQKVEVLHMIFNTYISESHKMQTECYDMLIHLITKDDINPDQLKELDLKYNVVSFYSALLHHIFTHFRNPMLIENVETLKDRIIGSSKTHSEYPLTFQMFDLIGGEYKTLDELFPGMKPDFAKISKQLSIDDKQFDIVVITRPTDYIYNPWNLTSKLEYDCIDVSVVELFRTIKPVESNVKLGVKIYSSRTNSKKYYYILETYDGVHYRTMTPWQVYPSTDTTVPYIPQNWLPGLAQYLKTGNGYPSGRVVAYNKMIETEILKYKGAEKEPLIKTAEVVNERGYIVGKLADWFNASIKEHVPANMTEYRELLNSEPFQNYVEEVIIDLLVQKYDPKNLTVYSTASILTRRISREILGIITKSVSLKAMYDTYPESRIKGELPIIFKSQIQQCMDIVVSYNSLLSSIDKVLMLDL